MANPVMNSADVAAALNNANTRLSSAPRSLMVFAAQASATLRWKAPLQGNPTSYIVRSIPATVDLAVTEPSATFTGLTNGIDYQFDVIPINAGGEGTSVRSRSIRPTVAPSGLSAIRDLAFWLNSDDLGAVYADGEAVVSVPDVSGNNRASTSVAALAFAASWSNGEPAITFNGTSSRLLASLYQADIGPKMTVFAAFEMVSTTGNKRIISFRDVAGPGNTQGALLDHNGTSLRAFADSNSLSASATIAATTKYIASAAFGDALFLNGARSTASLNYAPSRGGTQQISIGSNYGTADFASMKLAEVLIYAREISQAERWAVEAYLAAKYAITVTQA